MLLAVLLACDVIDPCVEPLEQWCWSSDAESGPRCEPLTADDATLESRCGNFDVASSGGGFSGMDWYFSARTGELVAVEHWTDTSEGVCGSSTWFGRRVACEPECMYGDTMGTLPACE
jgi:hypothetical protein